MLSIEQQLQLHYADIERYVWRLVSLLDDMECVQACTFELPRIDEGDTYAPITQIEPVRLDGFMAEVKGRRLYSEFYAPQGASTKCPIRMPGLLQYAGDPAPVANVLKALNAAKQAFNLSVVSINDVDLQFELVHKLFPRLINKQLTRNIHLMEPAVRSCGFSLGTKPLANKLSGESAEGLLAQRRDKWPIGWLRPEWEAHIDVALEDIRRLPPDAYLVQERSGKIQPVANVRYDAGITQKPAALPLLLVQPSTDKVKINPMRPFDLEKRRTRARRAGSKTATQIISAHFGIVAKWKTAALR
ncbi:DNA replication terminus site-binding protein [Neiella marina]|uniref:DNA replication terminus site-binding protein n=1 Tax=Neiella holothuriorum TaxID=2870530 RepID=A0ABS7EID9_9GAMM|nr:DNA replication terminus site-binding protein [Neiella holothuriorum]MBW8191407.1 DNA replication terminus site-binding protein [Neiella holothuriorum]